jgi:hypothetical protein
MGAVEPFRMSEPATAFVFDDNVVALSVEWLTVIESVTCQKQVGVD